MAENEKKEFVWKYESVLDHGITPEEFKELTGCDWKDRFDYLENSVDEEYAGCSDICSFYSRFRNNHELAGFYGKLGLKRTFYHDNFG